MMSVVTMSSHLDSSWRMRTDSLLLPVWLTSELLAYWKTALMGTSSEVFSGFMFSSTGTFKARTPGLGLTPTPALNVFICGPWSTASSHEKQEMILFEG